MQPILIRRKRRHKSYLTNQEEPTATDSYVHIFNFHPKKSRAFSSFFLATLKACHTEKKEERALEDGGYILHNKNTMYMFLLERNLLGPSNVNSQKRYQNVCIDMKGFLPAFERTPLSYL
jgi:hypothetical protein